MPAEHPQPSPAPESPENDATTGDGQPVVPSSLRYLRPLLGAFAGGGALLIPGCAANPPVAEQRVEHGVLPDVLQQSLKRIGVVDVKINGNVARFPYGKEECAVTFDAEGHLQAIQIGNLHVAFTLPLPPAHAGDLIRTGHAFHEHFQKGGPVKTDVGPSPRFTSDDGVRYTYEADGKRFSVTPLPRRGEECEKLEKLEVVSAPSDEDFRAWQRADAAYLAAWKAIGAFCKENRFGERRILEEKDFSGNVALFRQYQALSEQWSTTYHGKGAAKECRERCETRYSHPTLGAVTDAPPSDPKERSTFQRRYTRNGNKTVEFYMHDGMYSRETSLPPRPGEKSRTQRESFTGWRLRECQERSLDDTWKSHTAWHEIYRDNGYRVSRREGNTMQYFIPARDRAGDRIAATGEIRTKADGTEYMANVWLQGPEGQPIGTYRQHLERQRKEHPEQEALTPEGYARDVALLLSHNQHLEQLFYRLYWKYTPDRTPDPAKLEDRWKPGRGGEQYAQTTLQTLDTRQEGIPVHPEQVNESLFGDCEDLGEQAAYMHQLAGHRAYNICVQFDGEDGSRSSHAICFWITKNEETGRFHGHSQCTFGATKNGFPIDEFPENHPGFATPEECFQKSLTDFYGRHRLRFASCCRDRRKGIDLQNIWHSIPTDIGKDKTLTIADFVRPEGMEPHMPKGRLRQLLEKLGMPGMLLATGGLVALPLGLYVLRRRRRNRQGEEQEVEEPPLVDPTKEWSVELPAIPEHSLLDAREKYVHGTPYALTDTNGVRWNIVEWDMNTQGPLTPEECSEQWLQTQTASQGRLRYSNEPIPITLAGGSLYQEPDSYLFITNISGPGWTLHVELRTPMEGKRVTPRKKKNGSPQRKRRK